MVNAASPVGLLGLSGAHSGDMAKTSCHGKTDAPCAVCVDQTRLLKCSNAPLGLIPHVKESASHLLTARARNTVQWKQLSLSPSYSAYSGFAEPKSKSEYMRLPWRRQPVLSTPCSPYESVPIKGFPLSAVERFLPTLTI